MKRKIIQIAVTTSNDTNVGAIFALCNDGTLWWRTDDLGAANWQLEKTIPQSDVSKLQKSDLKPKK